MFHVRKSQSTLEYALFIAAVVAALISVQVYMKKSIRGRLRVSSDQIGDEFEPKHFSITRTRIGGQAD